MNVRRAVALGAAMLLAGSSAHAAVVVRTWKPSSATRYLTVCWADAVVDLPASPGEGAICSVEADNTTYVYHDGAWAAITGGPGGGNSFETVNAPAGTDPVADSSTDTLNLTASGGLTITGDSGTDTLDFVVGNVATATALAANPTACGAGDFVTDIAADGTLTCDTPAGGSGLTHPQIMARLAVGGGY